MENNLLTRFDYLWAKPAPTTVKVGTLVYAYQFDILSVIKERISNSCRDIVLEEMPHNGTFDYRQLYQVVAQSIDNPNPIEGLPYTPETIALELNFETEPNQCDGCRSGHPLNGNIHIVPYPSGSIGCTKYLYNVPATYQAELNGKIETFIKIK